VPSCGPLAGPDSSSSSPSLACSRLRCPPRPLLPPPSRRPVRRARTSLPRQRAPVPRIGADTGRGTACRTSGHGSGCGTASPTQVGPPHSNRTKRQNAEGWPRSYPPHASDESSSAPIIAMMGALPRCDHLEREGLLSVVRRRNRKGVDLGGGESVTKMTHSRRLRTINDAGVTCRWKSAVSAGRTRGRHR
jgi:hypothetical protein